MAQNAHMDEFRAAARGRECTACDSHMPATPFHVLRECGHAGVAAARAVVDGETRMFLRALADKVTRAARPYDRWGSVRTSSRAMHTALDTSEPLSDFLMFHVLLVAPWHEECVDLGARLDRAAGRMFDSAVVPNQAIHGVYNLWVPWSARRVTTLIKTWGRAVEDREVADAAPPGH